MTTQEGCVFPILGRVPACVLISDAVNVVDPAGALEVDELADAIMDAMDAMAALLARLSQDTHDPDKHREVLGKLLRRAYAKQTIAAASVDARMKKHGVYW